MRHVDFTLIIGCLKRAGEYQNGYIAPDYEDAKDGATALAIHQPGIQVTSVAYQMHPVGFSSPGENSSVSPSVPGPHFETAQRHPPHSVPETLRASSSRVQAALEERAGALSQPQQQTFIDGESPPGEHPTTHTVSIYSD